MDIKKEREAYKAALRNLENEFFFATPFDIWLAAKREAQAVPEGFVLVKQVHPDSIVHNQGLGLFKECQVIYGWNGKSKEFKDALNKGFYYGVKSGAKAVFETTVKPQEST